MPIGSRTLGECNKLYKTMGRIQITISGSLETECSNRLQTLYLESHNWLINIAKNVTKDQTNAEDLVQDLYVYLAEKCNPAIFWGKSYNIMYCQQFLKHRWINKAKKNSKMFYREEIHSNEIDVPYDEERDLEIQRTFDEVQSELKRLETTKLWPQSKIFQLYWCSDKTLDEVAKDIKISKSTTFLAVKKIRTYLKEVIDDPYKD
jgi:RNA polymerase sigma factor (sigma-70 family)